MNKTCPHGSTWSLRCAACDDELRTEAERLTALQERTQHWLDEFQGKLAEQTLEVERLRALVQEHITVHNCLVCGSETPRPPAQDATNVGG